MKRILSMSIVILMTVLMTSCTGDTGPVGPAGPPGSQGVAGDPGPIGAVIMWVTDTAPDGWLLCDGHAVSRTDFAYSAIGVKYGAGDGSNTFNLPDMRGRFPLGQDDMGGTSANRVMDPDADALGGAGGDEIKDISFGGSVGATTLTVAQSGVGAHTHDIRASDATGGSGNKVALHRNASNTASISGALTSAGGSSAPSSHTHALDAGFETQDFMNPFVVVNFIIRY